MAFRSAPIGRLAFPWLVGGDGGGADESASAALGAQQNDAGQSHDSDDPKSGDGPLVTDQVAQGEVNVVGWSGDQDAELVWVGALGLTLAMIPLWAFQTAILLGHLGADGGYGGVYLGVDEGEADGGSGVRGDLRRELVTADIF